MIYFSSLLNPKTKVVMKRFIGITILIFSTLVAAFCIIVTVGSNSTTVHRYAISQINKAIPGKLTLGKLHISILSLRFELHKLTLADSIDNNLAGFDKLLVDISLTELLKRKLVVQKAVLEHPWVTLEMNSEGRISLLDAFPQSEPPDTADSTSKLFPVELRSLDIIGGKVLFAAEQDSLKIQAYGLSISASGQTDSFAVEGCITLDSATLEQNGTPFHLHDLSLMARTRNSNLDTVNLRMHTGNSVLALNGSVISIQNDPVVDLFLSADLALSDIATIASIPEKLDGNANLSMRISGIVADPDLKLELDYGGGNIWGYPIESLSFKTQLAKRITKQLSLHIVAGLGSVAMTGSVDLRETFPDGFLKPGFLQKIRYELTASGDGIPLKELTPEISGTGAVSLSLQGSGLNPDSLKATLGLSADIAKLQLKSASAPLHTAISCSADIALGNAKVHTLSANLGKTTLALHGMYALASGKMSATLNLSLPSLSELLQFTGNDSITGSAGLEAQFAGDLQRPQALINAYAKSVDWGDIHIETLELNAGLENTSTAFIEELKIAKGTSQMRLSGSANVLENGNPIAPDQIRFDLALLSEKLDIGDFLDSVKGVANIDIGVKGTVDNPDGHIRITAEDILVKDQAIATLSLKARLEQQRAHIEPLLISLKPGQDLSINGWVALKDSFAVQLSSPGVFLNSVTALSSFDSLHGVLTTDLQAWGTYSSPEVQGKLGISDIHFGSMEFDDINLNLSLHNQEVKISGNAVGALLAQYHLDTKAFTSSFSLQDLQLAPYLALSGHDLEGTLTAAISVSGNADSISDIHGSLHVTQLVLDYEKIRIIESHDLKASVEKRQYRLPDFSVILAGEGHLKGRATGSFEGPHDVFLNGTIPLSIVRHFSEEIPDIDGSIDIDASLKGTLEKPDLKADLELRKIAMILPEVTQRLHSLNGSIFVNREAIRIEKLRGNLDDGVVSMRGEVKLHNLTPADLKADITLQSLPVSMPDMLDLLLDGKLRIAGTPDTTIVSGDIILVDGLYYQDIILNPLAGMGQRKRKKTEPQTSEIETPYLKNMRFDVGVQARTPFRVDNNMAQVTVAPDIQVMGSLNSPAINGRAKVELGSITYLKKTFTVKHGIIDFVNPYAIEPEIDVRGSVPVRDWVIEIIISGTPEDLVFKLACDDKTLEDQDLISLLLLGKTLTELQGGSGLVGGGQSNEQMLASLVASTFGDDIKKATGLDLLQIQTGDSNNEQSDRIAVTMGKQVTRRLGTKYTIESGNGEVVQKATAEYRLLQNLLIEGFQDTKGIYGGQIRFSWERR